MSIAVTVSGIGLIKKKDLYCIGLESIVDPEVTPVLVLGKKKFGNFLYCIGLKMDFWPKLLDIGIGLT